MRKNVASQNVSFHAVSTTDGSDVTTGTPTVYYTIDGGTQATGTGTSAHEGNGEWSYVPTQAETNGDHVAFTQVLSGSVSQTVNVWPVSFDPTQTNLLVDAVAISGDTTAADNLELQYDGTGLSGDNYPSTQAQVGNIASGSAAISTVAESYTLTTGTQSSGTVTDTETLDGTDHEHTDSAGAMELYYQFDVGGNGVASEVDVTGNLTGSNDSLGVFAYNWAGTSWDQVGTLSGTNSSTDSDFKYNLTTAHTGTGANLGKARLRYYAASGLTSATLSIDRITCAYSVVAQSAGYADGAVWIDTNDGTAGTESYVNGVADNPVDTLADALTIGGNLSLSKFRCSPDSSITFASSQPSRLFYGDGWTCALGGQDLSGTHIYHAKMTGTCTSPTAELHIDNSHIGTCSFGGDLHLSHSKLTDTVTLTAAGDVILEKCVSEVAGAGSPVIDMGAAVGATNLSVRDWRGGMTLNNLASGDVVTLDGIFGTITLNGADASVEIRGIAKAVTNNLTGSPTVNDDSVKADDIAAILADTADIQPKVATLNTAHAAGNLGCDVDKINGVSITGDGSATPFDV